MYLPHKRGRGAERQVGAALSAYGMQILSQNWHCRYGELDIVARDKDTLVFIEVKYRTKHSDIEQILTRKQLKSLWSSARMWVEQEAPQFHEHPWRFDAMICRAGKWQWYPCFLDVDDISDEPDN